MALSTRSPPDAYSFLGASPFASPHTKGAQPYWAQTLMRCFIRPTARRLGINKRVGWHTFRHTFSTLLKANGEDVKVVQELMRHASCKLTLDTYTQAVTPAKRKAQSNVVNLLRMNASQGERSGKQQQLFLFVPSTGERSSAKSLKALASPGGFEPPLPP
jgi:hypothetical protein